MSLVIVGHRGLLGSALGRRLKASVETNVVGLDLPDIDIASRRDVLETLSDIRPTVIINASGISDRDYLESHPNTARSIHVQGAANLAEAARRSEALLVQVSCVEAVYGESVFATTKRDAERAVAEWQRHLIVRGSMFFGHATSETNRNIVETILSAARRVKTFQVVSNILFSPTWVDDFAEALLALIVADHTGVCALANSGAASHADLAAELTRQAGLRVTLQPITSGEYGFTAPRAASVVVTDSAVPLRPWQDALAAYLASRQNGLPSS